ncbi:MAG: hypothetical protein JWP66_755 [Naasia sp.]|nr:hypothetical protein [Naasia sp.]
MRLSDLLSADLLPDAELAAMRLDGEVYRIGPGWRPVDLPETADARARALAAALGPGLVADRLTAAWLHGAADGLPAPLTACVPMSARGAAQRNGVDVRELRLQDGELDEVAGLRVTDAARTAVDLLRGRWGPGEREAARRLVADVGADVVRERLEDRRFTVRRRATLDRLAEVAGG